MLGVFGGEFDFDEDGESFVEGLGGGVEAVGGFEVVEGVDGVEDLGGFGGFVVLEGADEVRLRGEGFAWAKRSARSGALWFAIPGRGFRRRGAGRLA